MPTILYTNMASVASKRTALIANPPCLRRATARNPQRPLLPYTRTAPTEPRSPRSGFAPSLDTILEEE